MKIATAYSNQSTTQTAALEACHELRRRLGARPDVLFVNWSTHYNGSRLREVLAGEFAGCRIQGSSSCQGAMTEEGVISQDGRGLAMLGLVDPKGNFGTAGGELGDTPRENAAKIVLESIESAGRPGEMPDLVRISATPGDEDRVIAGIEDVLGREVPIIGGSAADNEVQGDWEIISQDRHWRQGLVITVFYPSTTVAYSFHNGYSPTLRRGLVTSASGRVIEEIDHRPAAEVYNEWTGGIIEKALGKQSQVLHNTTLFPLGRVVGEIGGVPYFSLSHPDRVTGNAGLSLFTDISVGDEVILMQGTFETLISRAGRVAQSALQAGRFSPEDISGALIVYCAGCMLTVHDRIDEVVNSLNQAMDKKPFLGAFTFGEQGCFAGGENRHANLMISAIVFGSDK